MPAFAVVGWTLAREALVDAHCHDDQAHRDGDGDQDNRRFVWEFGQLQDGASHCMQDHGHQEGDAGPKCHDLEVHLLVFLKIDDILDWFHCCSNVFVQRILFYHLYVLLSS